MDEKRQGDNDKGGRWYGYAQKLWAVVKGDSMEGLQAGARVVWFVLYTHADADTFTCNPSIATIGQLAGLNPQHATRCLAALERKGLIERRRSSGGRTRTEYRLIAPAVAPAQQQTNRRRNSTGRAGATPPIAPAQRQLSRGRNTNHNHEPKPVTNPIEPSKHGASRPCGRDGLGHVEEADLAKPEGWLKLYCRWQGCPTPTAINAALLNFAAAAVHALTATPKNGKQIKSRTALFASMIRKGDYSKVSNVDEDEARRRLNAHLFGTPAKREKSYDPTA